MSDAEETEEVEIETGVLNYPGKVDPTPGTLMGRGLDGKIWSVVGTVYDSAKDTSHVSVEEFVQAR